MYGLTSLNLLMLREAQLLQVEHIRYLDIEKENIQFNFKNNYLKNVKISR